MKKSTKIVVVYTILVVIIGLFLLLFLDYSFECFYAKVLSSKPDEYIDIIDLPESDPALQEAIANPSKEIRVDEPEKSAYYQIATSRGIRNVKVGDSYFYVEIMCVDLFGLLMLPYGLLASVVLAWMILYIVHHRRELGRTI